MGIENMRRWPMYIVFAVCILLSLSLFNTWSVENELRNKIEDIGTELAECSKQLQECSKQQASCMEQSLNLLEQKDVYVSKLQNFDDEKNKLSAGLTEYKAKVIKAETDANHTLMEYKMCDTELQSLKNLQASKQGTLEILRLDKDTLTSQLSEKKKRIEELEKEIERLKLKLTTKSVEPPAPLRVTPAAQPPKQSPSLDVVNALNEPVLDNNDAKEEIEDPNLQPDSHNDNNNPDGNNDGNNDDDFDPQLK